MDDNKHINKIIARGQERQNRHMKFADGFAEVDIQVLVNLVQDALKQMIHKNYAATYSCLECVLHELASDRLYLVSDDGDEVLIAKGWGDGWELWEDGVPLAEFLKNPHHDFQSAMGICSTTLKLRTEVT